MQCDFRRRAFNGALVTLAMTATFGMALPGTAAAAGYPDKPIKLVVRPTLSGGLSRNGWARRWGSRSSSTTAAAPGATSARPWWQRLRRTAIPC